MGASLNINRAEWQAATTSVFDNIAEGVTKSGIYAKPALRMLLDKKKTFTTDDGAVGEHVRLNYKGKWATIGNGQPARFDSQDDPQLPSFPLIRKQAGLVLAVRKLQKNGRININTHDSGAVRKGNVVEARKRLYDVYADEMTAWMEGYNDDLARNFWQDGVSNPTWGFPGITGFVVEQPSLASIGGVPGDIYEAWRNIAAVNLTVDTTTKPLLWYMTQVAEQIVTNNASRGAPRNLACFMGSAFSFTLMNQDVLLGKTSENGWARNFNLRAGGEDTNAPYSIGFNGVNIPLVKDPYLDILGKGAYCYWVDLDAIAFHVGEADNFITHVPEPEYNDFDNMYIAKTFTGGFCANRLETSAVMQVTNGLTPGLLG